MGESIVKVTLTNHRNISLYVTNKLEKLKHLEKEVWK